MSIWPTIGRRDDEPEDPHRESQDEERQLGPRAPTRDERSQSGPEEARPLARRGNVRHRGVKESLGEAAFERRQPLNDDQRGNEDRDPEQRDEHPEAERQARDDDDEVEDAHREPEQQYKRIL
jgi:hypothetical protein